MAAAVTEVRRQTRPPGPSGHMAFQDNNRSTCGTEGTLILSTHLGMMLPSTVLRWVD